MMQALDETAARQMLADGAVPLDLRPPAEFAAGHVPGAINLVFSPQNLGQRAAAVLPPGGDEPRLLLIGPDEPVPAEVWASLAAEFVDAGFPRPVGYLEGGTAAWQAAGFEVATLPLMSNAVLTSSQPKPAVLDVREPFEWEQGVIEGAHRVSLGKLPAALAGGPLPSLDPDQPVAVICAGGVRSSSAASLLRRHGYTQVANLAEGMQAWYRQRRPVVNG